MTAEPVTGEQDGTAELESFVDQIDSLPPGELGAGKYRLYKTPEGGLHLTYRPNHLDADCHFPVPRGFLLAAKVMSKGPIGALARHQARKAQDGDGG